MKRALHLIPFLLVAGAAFGGIPRVGRDMAAGLGDLMGVQPAGSARSGVRRQSEAAGGALAENGLADDYGVRTPRLATSQNGVALRLPPHSI